MSDRMRYREYLSEEEENKVAEKERKKLAVRERLEAAVRINKRTKGFMTPERKKKLKELLWAQTQKQIRLRHEVKEKERRKVIDQRVGEKQQLDCLDEDELKEICKEFQRRITKLEDIKYDLEYEVRQKDFVVNELSIEVNNLKGKFVKPMLKKVKKYDPKIAMEKMAKVAAKAETNHRNKLKRVQSVKYTIGDDEKQARPEWALKKEPSKSEADTED